MNFIKRAFWSMKAKKGKTFLQLVVFSVICIFVLSGLTIQSAAKKSSELARQQLGGSVTLQADRQKQMAQQQKTVKRGRLNQRRFPSQMPRSLHLYSMLKITTSSRQRQQMQKALMR